MNYNYKLQQRKNGNHYVSVRDNGENALLEVEKIGDQVKIVTYWRNDSTTRFTLPLELFEKLYNDITQNK